jgi:hypothetical protein
MYASMKRKRQCLTADFANLCTPVPVPVVGLAELIYDLNTIPIHRSTTHSAASTTYYRVLNCGSVDLWICG